MNCRRCRALLPAYLDGELPEGVRLRVRAHLELCPACREEADELTAVTGMLAALPDPPLPAGLEQRLHLRLVEAAGSGAGAAGASPAPGAPGLRRRRFGWPLAAGVAAAAALAVAVGVAGGGLRPGGPRQPGVAVEMSRGQGGQGPTTGAAGTAGRAPAGAPEGGATAGARGLAAPATQSGGRQGQEARNRLSLAPAEEAAATFELRVGDPRLVAGLVAERLAQLGSVRRDAVFPGQSVSVEVEYASPVSAAAVAKTLESTAEANGGSVVRQAPPAFSAPGGTSEKKGAAVSSVERVTVVVEGGEGNP
ncbi:MAG: anti-sigma factor [Bacillota bacterium]|nr:anti-sigma factor [Bacillota bacterium]